MRKASTNYVPIIIILILFTLCLGLLYPLLDYYVKNVSATNTSLETTVIEILHTISKPVYTIEKLIYEKILEVCNYTISEVEKGLSEVMR